MILYSNFADLNIEIQSKFPRMKEFCRDYLIEETACQFCVSASSEEIRREDTGEYAGMHQEDYLELLAIQRKIAEQLPFYQRFLMHGAVVSYDEKAYMFTALSGTGKTTHIRLWKKYLGDAVKVINGDKPFLWVREKDVQIYGTPWCGKEGWNTNCHRPLAGICIICRGQTNRIERVDAASYLFELMQQVYMPTDPAAVGFTLELLDKVLRTVPLYRLECDMSEEAVRTSFEAMTKEADAI